MTLNLMLTSKEAVYLSGDFRLTSMDVHNNNLWLVEAIARAATDNHWSRVDVKAGDVAPGVNGGLHGAGKSPLKKGGAYGISGKGMGVDGAGGGRRESPPKE